MLSPLQHKAFAALWACNIASSIGGIIQSVGASWMMTSLDPSPQMVALVQFANVAPIMLLSLLAGALADLYDRRAIMLASQCTMAIMSAALAVASFLTPINPWVLLIFTFAIATGAAIHLPAWQSSISDQVPRHELAGAVSLNAFGFNVARSIAPAIGGALIAAAGAPAAFTVNALSYTGLIIALWRWSPSIPKSPLPKESLSRAISGGLRYISMSPVIIGILLRAGLFGFCGAALWALMPLIARNTLHGGPLMYGAVLGAFGAGAMTSALMTTRLRARFKSDTLVNTGSALFGVSTIVAGVSIFAPLTMLFAAGAGAAWVLVLSTCNVAVQTSSPRWVAGRTIAVYQLAAFGGLATGSAIWGAAATHYGLPETLAASGVLMIVSLLWAARFKMPSLEGAALDPWSRTLVFRDPILEMTPRSGPIAVSIEYRVAAEDAANFTAAMQEMGRIRRRDGARRWSLTQDIDDPEIWTEHYHSPTWLDHLHRQNRPTIADEAARAHVLSFHRGGSAPVVRRMLERPTDIAMRDSAPTRADGLQDLTPP